LICFLLLLTTHRLSTTSPWKLILPGSMKNHKKRKKCCQSYVYDTESGLYYLQSRYYDPEIGRFINADDTSYLGVDGTPLSYNLFAYCGNNPVLEHDPNGNFGLLAAIIVTGTIVGGILGAFSAASTGGNVVEGFIEGCLTGALGASCGLLIPSTWVAVAVVTAGGAVIDFATQATTQYINHKSVDLSEINYYRVVKTGVMTGAGVAVPKFGAGAGNSVDAFGTALIWAETSTMITCVDVIATNSYDVAHPTTSSPPVSQNNTSSIRRVMMQK